MSTRDLGSVTSYAMAVALGFEGTEAEWVTAMMEAGDNAASAAASAASASASATSAEASAETARINYGSPLAASTLSAMTEQNRVYVYTGVEQGMTYGDWYYYDGSGWVDGGIYNSAAEMGGIIVVDTVAEMVDTESVYLYNGTQTGYTAGHWYFYNIGTSSWTDGGEYTGWETVGAAVEEYLQENAQEIKTLSIVIGGVTYTYNGSANVSVTLPVYNGGVS